MAEARARKESMAALQRSVRRRSSPKLFIQEFVRSTTQRPPVWIGVLAPRGATWASIRRSARSS